MLKIGDFSKLTQVSVRMLRYYDQHGLLSPPHTDPHTGHRFYELAQMKQTQRIRALQDAGLSLDDIRDVFHTDPEAETVATLLRDKRDALQSEIDALTMRLYRLDARLHQLGSDAETPDLDVVLKSVPAMLAATSRALAPQPHDVPFFCEKTLTYLAHFAHEGKLPVTGEEMLMYHNDGYVEENYDIEAALVLDLPERPADIDLPTGVQIVELPAVLQMATVVYEGALREMGPTFQGLLLWIARSGYEIIGPSREVHHDLVRAYEVGDSAHGLVELQIPVRQGE